MQIKNLYTLAPSPAFAFASDDECPCMGSVEDCPWCCPSPGEGEWPSRSNDDYTPSSYDDDGIPF